MFILSVTVLLLFIFLQSYIQSYIHSFIRIPSVYSFSHSCIPSCIPSGILITKRDLIKGLSKERNTTLLTESCTKKERFGHELGHKQCCRSQETTLPLSYKQHYNSVTYKQLNNTAAEVKKQHLQSISKQLLTNRSSIDASQQEVTLEMDRWPWIEGNLSL